MNINILNTKVQNYINTHLKSDVSRLLLKGLPFNTIKPKFIIEQIEAKKRCEKKLPTWYATTNIYYPNKLNIAQASSEITAAYKAKLANGHKLIDITGGFGVDSYYFSKYITHIIHCEIDRLLSEIAKHNFKILQCLNIQCINKNGIDILKHNHQNFDWLYIDPSRRNNNKQKVFLLADCIPNVETFQNVFLKHAKKVMIKTSPLLDISAALKVLKHVKTIHIVAVNNEVKELIWILERRYIGKVKMITANIQKESIQNFEFNIEEEIIAKPNYSKPLTYLYEPNAAILKSGAFNIICNYYNIFKLHKHTHLYTSKNIINFPGRCFKIEKQLAFNKKEFAKENIQKANVTIRHFPLPVITIRKKLNIKDGGDTYLFFTTTITNEKTILICSKLK